MSRYPGAPDRWAFVASQRVGIGNGGLCQRESEDFERLLRSSLLSIELDDAV